MPAISASSHRKTLLEIQEDTADGNIPCDGLCGLLRRLGFNERVRGSRHIVARVGVEEILNLQPMGAQVKRCQVKQVRAVVLKYKMAEDIHDEV